MTQYFARGSVGHSSVSHSSVSHTSTSRPSSTSTRSTSTSTRSTTSTKPSVTAQRTSTRPGTAIRTSSGRTVRSSTAHPRNIRNARETGIVGANGYTPRFNNYSAPAGSVVYYQQHSALDYLPWIYLFSQSSPRDDKATVVQPDNKQVTAQQDKGFDGLFVLNWIIFIILIVAAIAGVMYLVNKFTKKGGTSAAY